MFNPLTAYCIFVLVFLCSICICHDWLIAGTLFLTVLTSDPSQRLGVQLNKSIFHDFSDINILLELGWLKMQDLKMEDQNRSMTRKCRTWKWRTKLQGMKMQDLKMQDLKMEDQIAGHENGGQAAEIDYIM